MNTRNRVRTPLPSLSELREMARGKWAWIFEDLAPELQPAIEAAGHHVPCPVHGGKDGFRLFQDFNDTGGGCCNTCGNFANGFALLVWIKGYEFKDAVREVGQWIRGEQASPTVHRRPLPPVVKHYDAEKASAMIKKILRGTLPIRGTPGERYFAARGIWPQNVPATLRFHPGLKYYHGKDRTFYGTFPAVVAPIRNPKGEIIALHRIFITDDGKKAPVPEPKKMTLCAEPPNGSAIKLFPAGKTLGVGEGIETMLAVHTISRMPVWSAVAAPLLEHLEVPESVQYVVIWADNDRSGRGQQAAETLAVRLKAQGMSVEIQVPPQQIPEGAKGIDWLDVLLTHGLEGFPQRWRRYRPAA